ncbi:MAG: N-formylglutamate amidohydrolase [Alphaproteobacteria bacterium]|nr:N-formylglutamate amidohydrolase [Alphaproteobacteria bacterium]
MPARERAAIEGELTPSFQINRPVHITTPVVFCSPHSGRIYPKHFLEQSALDPRTLRRSEDCYVDLLYNCAPDYGAPLIAALFPRAYLDLNREPYELDPCLFGSKLPDYANAQSTRVLGGLGTIARIVGDGTEIYEGKLSLAAGLARIEGLYHPFHDALRELLDDTRLSFGHALLIDCHSMPSNSMLASPPRARPDIVLGDRFGTSCDPQIVGFLRAVFEELGYAVHINRPYAGGFITEHYGRPTLGINAVQVEINRGLYLDEKSLEPLPGFERLQSDLETVVARLTSSLPGLLHWPAAAE